MYCKDCNNWKPYTKIEGYSYPENNKEVHGGYCESQFITEDSCNRSDYKENALVYSYYESGSFWTGAKFGCVNFEDKCEAL